MKQTKNNSDNSFFSNVSGFSRVVYVSLMVTALLLNGCGRLNQQAANTDDYVEIDNPFASESPDAAQKIWVPRASVQSGLQRGSVLASKGLDKLIEPSAVLEAGKPPVATVRNRLLIAEAGAQKIGTSLGTLLSRGSIVKIITLPGTNDVITDQEQLAFIAGITNQASGGPILFLSKPEGLQPGARIKGDLIDIRGPQLIRSFWVTVPKPAPGQNPEDALLSALKGLAQTAHASLEWFPWYGRVVSIVGTRIYIDTGGESGLKVGQRLNVYRGGEVIAGIGFASGELITTFQISTYVGQNGSYGTSPQADLVKPGDYVELEK